jgi:Ca-activated chloride channel family protein
VVNLSIRYGIITPYTSYLIEEDDILGQANRQTIVEEAIADFAAPAAVSGEAAVERAEEEGAMAEAEVAQAAPIEVTRVVTEMADEGDRSRSQPVQFVGDKTFVYRDGRWLDTAYDPDASLPQQIVFASDAYFELLSALPEVGQYLALGQNVLFVYGEQVYEIVTGEGQTTLVLPQPTPTGAPNQAVEPNGPMTIVTTAVPTQEIVAIEPAAPTRDGEESQRSVGTGLCTAAFAMPLILGAGIVIGRKKERRN